MAANHVPFHDADARLTLTTFGVWALTYPQAGQGVVPIFGPSKPLALLAYLTCCPGRSASREHLVDLLWADLEPDAAQHAFRQTLWYIRHRLGAEAIHSSGGVVALVIPVDTDRDRFLTAVAGQDYACAAQLYRGDFLPGFAAPGGAEFERWADIERARVRGLFVRAAESLTRQRLTAGRLKDATALARRVRDADRDLEAGWRLLIETLIASQDWLSAAVEADALARFLAEESRVPEPATRALLRTARQQPGTPDAYAPAQLVAELVGREAEFSAILSAWQEVKAGKGRHVHVVAPAGLGKTRLLADVNARLRAGGAAVAAVRANPGERALPFALAAELAVRLAALPGAKAVSPATAATLVGLNPSLAVAYAEAQPNGSTDLILHRSIALADIASAIADESPLALLVDDLHWADDASRTVLSSVLERLAGEHVLVVTTTRPRPEQAIQREFTQILDLAPLTTSQVRDLLTSIARLPDEPWAAGLADGLHGAAQGSPLLVLETLQLALELERLRRDGDAWGCPDAAALGQLLAEGSALARRIADLTRDQAWLLALLATAGAPVPAMVLEHAASRSPAALRPDMLATEQRALAVRAGDGWTTAHDEIASRVLAGMTPEATRAAHLALGLGWQAVPERRDALRLAARHLLAAAEQLELAKLAVRWTRSARRDGDRRPALALVAELLGEEAASANSTALVRRLPLRLRLGLDRPRRLAAVVVLGAVGSLAALGAALRTSPRQPDAMLYVVGQDSAGSLRSFVAPVRFATWGDLDAVRPAEPATNTIQPPAIDNYLMDYQPAQRIWAYTKTFEDSGGIDLVIRDAAGRDRRVTFAKGDDMAPSFAPDARAVAFETGRWNSHSWYDIAILDLRTGAARQLTTGDALDAGPQWSPRGTRIAFSRQYRSGDSNLVAHAQLCWITPDGSRIACRTTPWEALGVRAWYDDHQVIVDAEGEDGRFLARYDLDQATWVRLKNGTRGQWVSGDGHWVVCRCAGEGRARPTLVVFPTDRPDLERRLILPRGWELANAGFTLRQPGREPIVRTAVAGPAGPIQRHLRYRLRALGLTAAGESVAVDQVISWSVSDTAVASVDSAGVLTPRRIGTVVVRASAGGWSRDSIRLSVSDVAYAMRLRETWTDTADWFLYGEPWPDLARGPRGAGAFSPNGDSSFPSGAFSRRAVSSRNGVGLEARVSTPLSAINWQSLDVALMALPDTLPFARWDRKTGAPPVRAAAGNRCDWGYPGRVTATGRRYFSVGGVEESADVPADSAASTGAWYVVRLQIFPDGRCGIAINGLAVWRSEGSVRLDLPYRIGISSMSHRTRILVGPLEVWEGVRHDVDWAALDRPTRHP